MFPLANAMADTSCRCSVARMAPSACLRNDSGRSAIVLHILLACIASVSASSSRKLGQEQKKKGMRREGEGSEGSKIRIKGRKTLGDKSLRVYRGRFVKLFVLRQDTNSQIPTDSTLQTVAKTKSCRRFQCTEILQVKPSDLSLRLASATCCIDIASTCNNLSPDSYKKSDLSPRRGAATCRLVCSDTKGDNKPQTSP